MGGTCDSGVLSSADDVLEMSVVKAVFGSGRVGVVGERIGFGLYQFWRNMWESEICVCVSVAMVWVVVGAVGGRLEPGSGRVLWCYVCESGLFVLMAGPGICILC